MQTHMITQGTRPSKSRELQLPIWNKPTNKQTHSSAPSKMNIVATVRGGEFMYTVKSENKSKLKQTWRCVRRVADSCHAILQTTNDEVYTFLLHLVSTHNFKPNQ